MKFKMVFAVFIGLLVFYGCSKESQETSDSKPMIQLNQQGAKSEPKKEVIKRDSQYVLKEKREEYRTTAYDSRLLPDPNSNTEITRIPPNTKLKVLEKKTVQQGRMQNNWYKVIIKVIRVGLVVGT